MKGKETKSKRETLMQGKADKLQASESSHGVTLGSKTGEGLLCWARGCHGACSTGWPRPQILSQRPFAWMAPGGSARRGAYSCAV